MIRIHTIAAAAIALVAASCAAAAHAGGKQLGSELHGGFAADAIILHAASGQLVPLRDLTPQRPPLKRNEKKALKSVRSA